MALVNSITLGDGLIGTQAGTTGNVTTITSSGTITLDPEIETLIQEITDEIVDLSDILTNYSGGIFGGHW